MGRTNLVLENGSNNKKTAIKDKFSVVKIVKHRLSIFKNKQLESQF